MRPHNAYRESRSRARLGRVPDRRRLVKFIEMPFTDIVQALAQNRIDAGELTEPFVSQGKKVGRVLSNCMATVAKRYLMSAYVTTTAWAQAHPEAARKFEEVMRQTAIRASVVEAFEDVAARGYEDRAMTALFAVRSAPNQDSAASS